MSVDDYRINASVRRILSRCWVDEASVRYGAIARTVYIHGRFEKVRSGRPEQTETWDRNRPEDVSENLALLESVEKEIRREPGVVDVVFKLDNFRKVQGRWSAAGG